MALLPYRGCSRFSSSFSLTRLFVQDSINLNRSSKTRLPLSSAGVRAERAYSSDRGTQKQKVVVVGVPNPFIWFRTRIYYFLIKTYFDTEFSIEEFTEGAKQVCCCQRVHTLYFPLKHQFIPCCDSGVDESCRLSVMSRGCCHSVSSELSRGWWPKM